MASTKTAISIESTLLRQIDALAADLGLARSRLMALAAEQFLKRHQNAELLSDLNASHADGPTEEEVDARRAWKRQHRRRIQDAW